MFDHFPRGVILEQNKEPALSRPIQVLSEDSEKRALLERPAFRPESASPEEIIDLAKDANIIDETDGRPLSEKLKAAMDRGYQVIGIDAIDDEPYISSQLAPALQLAPLMKTGLELVQRALGISQCYAAVCRDLFDAKIQIPREILGIPVKRIPGYYPVSSAQIRRSGRGTLLLGACCLIHLGRAAKLNMRQTTCFVTVAGDCIGNPCNLEVPIGCTVQKLLTVCGLIQDPRRVVIGGSMRGYAITEPEEVTVNVLTRGIVAFHETFKEMNLTCIGCGRCAAVCPEGLSPYYLYKFLSSGRYRMLQNFDIERCTGCGTCSYVCPAKLDLSAVIQRGKREAAFRKNPEPPLELREHRTLPLHRRPRASHPEKPSVPVKGDSKNHESDPS